MDKMDIPIYGHVICKEDISLDEWGTYDGVLIKKGDRLDITYHEYNGVIGLTKDKVELHCAHSERKNFEEHWNEVK